MSGIKSNWLVTSALLTSMILEENQLDNSTIAYCLNQIAVFMQDVPELRTRVHSQTSCSELLNYFLVMSAYKW
jgi:hypothetical protein